jgi:uncharacterized membrane protein
MFEFLVPLHPKVVHFPIALFTTALGFECVSLIFKKEQWHKVAVSLAFVATVLLPIVVRTGIIEEHRLHLSHPLLTSHEYFANRVMYLALASLPILWFIKRKSLKYFRICFIVLLLAIVSLITIVAHKGGQMVYEYGVGVDL